MGFIFASLLSISVWATAESYSYNCKLRRGSQPDPASISVTVSGSHASFSTFQNYEGTRTYTGSISLRDRGHLKNSNTVLIYNFQDFDFSDASLGLLGTKALIAPSLL